MNSRCTGRQSNYSLVLSHKGFQVFLKAIHIRAKRNNPVGIKCFLNKLLLIARQVAKAQENSFFSSFHIVLHFLV